MADCQSAPCPEGTRIYQKPTASSEGAQLWDEQTPSHPLLVPRSGTDYFSQHHMGSVSPPSGNYMGWKYRTYPQLRCFAACSGFHDIGPAPRNPQLIISFLRSRGRRRHRIQARYTYARSDPGLRRRTRWWCPRGRCGGRARCPQAKQSRRPRERASGCPW